MMDRWSENGLMDVLGEEGIGCIPFSPLEQGILTDKYLEGIPENSRAAKSTGFLQLDQVTSDKIEQAKKLNEIAKNRNQSLAQMAVTWLLKDKRVTSVLVGVSSKKQLLDNLGALENKIFSSEELERIETILKS